MRTVNSDKKNNAGFTLVELIVVLLILAVLAALLVPQLLGFIDRAKREQSLLNARHLRTAAQAEFDEAYGKATGTLKLGDPVIPLADGLDSSKYGPNKKNGDVNLVGSDFAAKVLKIADMEGDKEPYCFMVAVGSNHDQNNKKPTNVTKHDKYTVYYVLYMETEKSDPIYYYNGEFSHTNPRSFYVEEVFDEYNYVKTGKLEGMRLQYYIITNHTGKNFMSAEFWDYIKGLR